MTYRNGLEGNFFQHLMQMLFHYSNNLKDAAFVCSQNDMVLFRVKMSEEVRCNIMVYYFFQNN